MNFAPSRFIVYTNEEEESSEVLSMLPVGCAQAAGETPTLPEAAPAYSAEDNEMTKAERVFAGLGVEDEV